MLTWRDAVLEHFNNYIPHLLIVTDPDGLLQDEEIIGELKNKRLEIVEFQDRATFRYLYEQYFRGFQDRYLLVYLRHDDVEVLPYDLVESSLTINLRISVLFPGFAHRVIQQLDSQALDALYAAYEEPLQGSLSTQETCDYLIRKVYKLAYDIVETKEELIKLLLQKHESNLYMPPTLEEYLVNYFSADYVLKSLPIRELMTSKMFYYQYLQSDWEKFIDGVLNNQYEGKEHRVESYYHQPLIGHSETMKHVFSQLFIEGKLKPITTIKSDQLPKWTHVGIVSDTIETAKERVSTLIQKIENQMKDKLTYKQWIEIAKWFCAIKYLVNKHNLDQFDTLPIKQELESKFKEWMLTDYSTLASLPYVHHPVMVHQIPQYMRIQNSTKKVLIVLDGMSFIQWKQIEEALSEEFHFDVHGSFAWVPTVTSVSRQALFSGELPFYFAETINTTSKEPASWQLYWEKESIQKMHISYQKGLGQETYDASWIQALQKSNTKIAGIVIDTIDKLMHGAILGHKGMIAELEVWLHKGYLQKLLRDLSDAGYAIYLTSDHGNHESTGIGRIQEGVLAETRGERVRIYKNEVLRDQAAQEHSSILWPNVGLPNDRFMLLAKNGDAFITKGEQVVSHGGISIEEVIVPFVHVTRKENIQ